MTDKPNPWGAPRRPPYRVYLWLALLVAVTSGLWLLARAFPERTLSNWDEARMIEMVAILALVSSGIVMSRRFTMRESLRNIGIWVGVAALLAVGYVYSDVFSDIGTRFTSALLPGEPVDAGDHTVVIGESEGGAYYVTGEVDGTRVRFQIDTGASSIVLSPDDARRIGIAPDGLRFNNQTATANGIGRSADETVDSLAVGPIRFADVPVSINQAPMDTSLLGMTFLRRLKSFAFANGKLYLRW